MNRLFGYHKNTPKVSLNDAVLNIDERVGSLDVKLSKINSELTTYQQKISKMGNGPGKAALKQKALKLLKQRKQIESQKDQLENQSWNMSQAAMTTDNLQNTMITIDAMKTANKQLKKTYGKVDVDKLESLQDEMLDLIDKSNELQESLLMSYDVPEDISESELDAELEALGDEVDYESQMTESGQGIPAYLDSETGGTDKLPAFIEEPTEEDATKVTN